MHSIDQVISVVLLNSDLTADLEKNILGLRKTAMGFEGLITANAAVQYKHCVLDTATIDDIIICIGKGGTKA